MDDERVDVTESVSERVDVEEDTAVADATDTLATALAVVDTVILVVIEEESLALREADPLEVSVSDGDVEMDDVPL